MISSIGKEKYQKMLVQWKEKFSKINRGTERQCQMDYEISSAAANGEIDLVRILLELGANSRAYGNTIAILAARNQHDATLRCLLSHQAGLKERDTKKLNWLRLGILANNEPVIIYFWEKADIKTIEKSSTYMCLSARRGYIGLVEYFLSKGAKINRPTGLGKTALHMAAERGCLEVIKLLVEKGAELEFSDNQGLTPLIAAIERKQSKAILLLLALGANKDIKVNDITPYDLAKKQDYFDDSILQELKPLSCFKKCCAYFFASATNTAKVTPEAESVRLNTSKKTKTLSF